MTIEELKSILGETGYPWSMTWMLRNPAGSAVSCLSASRRPTTFADNAVSRVVARIEAEMCTGERKDPAAEKKVMEVLTAGKIAWQKTKEGFAEDSGLFFIFYEFEEVMDE